VRQDGTSISGRLAGKKLDDGLGWMECVAYLLQYLPRNALRAINQTMADALRWPHVFRVIFLSMVVAANCQPFAVSRCKDRRPVAQTFDRTLSCSVVDGTQ